jgi:phospholipid/cholesterol/gamma-HCH transport system permease protein
MPKDAINQQISPEALPQACFNADREVLIAGRWCRDLQRPEAADVTAAFTGSNTIVKVKADALEDWDSTLLIFIASLEKRLAEKNVTLDFSGLPPGMVKLLSMRNSTLREADNATGTHGKTPGLVEICGELGLRVWNTFISIVDFVGTLAVDLAGVFGKHSKMRPADLRNQMVQCGPRALGIITLISFLMGLILAFIGSIPLRWFQAESYVASLVGIGMLRLMAPVMVGIVMAGRTSASYAAELGSMQVNEEIDAMETMGISSMQFLVLPRFIAMSLMLPLLCVFADIVSVLGGMMVACGYLKITALSYFDTLFTTTRVSDLLVGIFTAFVLGILDGICGCYQGMKCGRSAASVGSATTGAVVSSIICIVIATSLITVLTVVLGI